VRLKPVAVLLKVNTTLSPSLPPSLQSYLIDSSRQQREEGQASVLNGGGETVCHPDSIFRHGKRDGRPEHSSKSTVEEGMEGHRVGGGGGDVRHGYEQ
jgi:hypothetical protein